MRTRYVFLLGIVALAVGPARVCIGAVVSFQGLGNPTVPSMARAASWNGDVVIGVMGSSSGWEAFRWTRSCGMVGLGELPGGWVHSEASGVSADGSVVVGISSTAVGWETFRWTQSTGMVGLGNLAGDPYNEDHACDVSADGSVIVGKSGDQAFRWTESSGMVGLGYLAEGDPESIARGVSADGSVIVGESGGKAFRWTDAAGMVGLGDLSGGDGWTQAWDVSADGSIIVGTTGFEPSSHVFRWTASQGMTSIGLGTWPITVSGDGSVVVGNMVEANAPFYWTQSGGMRNLRELLEDDYGLDLSGWVLYTAFPVSLSGDGRTVVGLGQNSTWNTQAWAATIPEPAGVALLGLGGLMLLRKRRA